MDDKAVARQAVRQARKHRDAVDRLRVEAAEQLAEVLRAARRAGVTASEIAGDARMTKQAVYEILKEKGQDTTYWLVCVGTNERPYSPRDSDWRRRRKEWANVVGRAGQTFPRRPRMNPGDVLVSYAVGSAPGFGKGKVFAVDEVTSSPEACEHPRWSWIVGTRLLGGVRSLRDAPGLSDIDVDPRSVRRQSHIRLTREQGEKAIRLILDDKRHPRKRASPSRA